MQETQISELNLSARARNVLEHNGNPKTLREARQWVLVNVSSYGRFPNCGKKTMTEICEAVGFPTPKLTQFPSDAFCASYAFNLHREGHLSAAEALERIGRYMKWA